MSPQPRTAAHYHRLLDDNPAASVGFALAASAVYAEKFGTCESSDHGTPEWSAIARSLKAKYGESLTPDQVRAEMRRG